GKVEEGNTVSDFDADETKRKVSVNLSLLPFEWKGRKVNLIDTPGYLDFAGEVREAMRVADTALLLLSAPAGLEVGTELAWAVAERAAVARMLLVNKMDRENADFERTLSEVQARLSNRCVAFHLPVGAQDSFQGVIDLVEMKAYMGAKGEAAEIPAELQPRANQLREKLIEAAAATHED